MSLGLENILWIAGDDDVSEIGMLLVAFFRDVDRGTRATLQFGDGGALAPDDEADQTLLDSDGFEAIATGLHLPENVRTARPRHDFDHFFGFFDGLRRASN